LATASRGLKRPWFWLLVVGLIAADLLSKHWAFDSVGEHQPRQLLIGEWLSFYCIRNAGGIWGLGNDSAWVTPVLTVIRMIAVVALIVFVRKQADSNRMGLFTLGLLVAGAIGNLYDNLSTWMPWAGDGKVRDFILVDIPAPGWWPIGWPLNPFPVFNIADACISVGFLLLITGFSQLHLHTAEESKPPPHPPQPE
jgi:signal peptidase II